MMEGLSILANLHRSLGLTVAILLVLAGSGTACRPMPLATEPSPAASPEASVTPVQERATGTAVPAAATATPAPIPSVTSSPVPSSTPTTTPQMITLTVPQEWQERVERALSGYQPPAGIGGLRVSGKDGGQIQLVAQETDYGVWREPIAFAVPFASDWQGLTYERAMTILEDGHEQIEVMPWSGMPLGMRALAVDGRSIADDDYPLQQNWSLQPHEGYEDVARDLLPPLRVAADRPIVHLAAVGDIMLDRSLGAALEKGNLTYPFTKSVEELQAADITAGNLESALGSVGQPVGKRYPFRAPPEAAEALALAGFDIMSLANNHAGDYGPEALLQGLELLEAQGIAAAGAGRNVAEAHQPRILQANGLKLAFLSYVHVPVEASTGFDTASWRATEDAPGLAWADPEQVKADVSTVRAGVDLVIVLLHSGFEYQATPSEPQMAAARAAIDAGASLVIGHHAHILQGIEFYKQGAIIYGTGNFAFEIDGPPETAIFHVWLSEEGVRQIEISPAIIQFGGQPRLAESWEATPILSRIRYLTGLLNSH